MLKSGNTAAAGPPCWPTTTSTQGHSTFSNMAEIEVLYLARILKPVLFPNRHFSHKCRVRLRNISLIFHSSSIKYWIFPNKMDLIIKFWRMGQLWSKKRLTSRPFIFSNVNVVNIFLWSFWCKKLDSSSNILLIVSSSSHNYILTRVTEALAFGLFEAYLMHFLPENY